MRAAWVRKEDCCDPAHRTKKPAWICGKNTSKTRSWSWQKRWNSWNIPTRVGIWFHKFVVASLVVAMAFSIAGATNLKKMWEGPYWEGVWLCLDPLGCGAFYVHQPAVGMSPGNVGHTASFSSSSLLMPFSSKVCLRYSPLLCRPGLFWCIDFGGLCCS